MSMFNADSNSQVRLLSSDGKEFRVLLKIASVSTTVKKMLESTSSDDHEVIPMHNVPADMLKIVLEYCENYVSQCPESSESQDSMDEDDSLHDECDPKIRKESDLMEWEKQFCKPMDFHALSHLLMAADYMDVKPLRDLIGITIANFLKDKKVSELRELCGIPNDFTPEEEDEMRECLKNLVNAPNYD